MEQNWYDFTLKGPADIACQVKINSISKALAFKIDGKLFEKLPEWKFSAVPLEDDIRNEQHNTEQIERDPDESSDDEVVEYPYEKVDEVYSLYTADTENFARIGQ